MSSEPIRIFNRGTGRLEEEAVYGEGFLRWAYGNPLGRLLTRSLVSRAFVSRFYGWLMSRPSSAAKVQPFIEQYGVDEGEFAEPVESFTSFNAFFTRRLKAEARPVDADPSRVVLPADGRHSGWQEIANEPFLLVKGQVWDIRALLADLVPGGEVFENGTLVLSRLCPVDYHHYHFPVNGREEGHFWSGQRLFSVSPLALKHSLAYMWENKRCIRVCESPEVGRFLLIEVGATNVGSIHHHPLGRSRAFCKGDAAGWFSFGGSSIITLFESGRLQLADDLIEQTRNGIELYARMGEVMGTLSAP